MSAKPLRPSILAPRPPEQRPDVANSSIIRCRCVGLIGAGVRECRRVVGVKLVGGNTRAGRSRHHHAGSEHGVG